MNLKNQLKAIVDPSCIIDDPALLLQYSVDQSFVSGTTPVIAVKAREVKEIQEIMRLANRESMPVVPYSSGLNLHGAALPAKGGIVLDLSGMDRILDINEKDWFVTIEPGVTYESLQKALVEKGLRLMAPFGVPPRRSVLTSYLERDPLLAAAHTEYGNYLILDTELILPDGELLRTGVWNLGGRPGGFYGPGLNTLYKLWTGAQGTLGIFTKMIISVQHLSPQRKFFFIPFESSEKIAGCISRIQRKEIGWECFGLNRFNMAALLNDEWSVPDRFPAAGVPSSHFTKLLGSLPPWTVIIGLSGSLYYPEERVHYEEDALRELCCEMGIAADTQLPGFPDLDKIFLRESLAPWGILKKFNFRGSVHDVSFKIPLNRLHEIEMLVTDIARERAYPPEAVGAYFVVLERGRAAHCEFDLHGGAMSPDEREPLRNTWLAAGRALMDRGALFDRPYGAWAEMVYARAPQYAQKLRQIKAEMDPQGILNPGRLCF